VSDPIISGPTNLGACGCCPTPGPTCVAEWPTGDENVPDTLYVRIDGTGTGRDDKWEQYVGPVGCGQVIDIEVPYRGTLSGIHQWNAVQEHVCASTKCCVYTGLQWCGPRMSFYVSGRKSALAYDCGDYPTYSGAYQLGDENLAITWEPQTPISYIFPGTVSPFYGEYGPYFTNDVCVHFWCTFSGDRALGPFLSNVIISETPF
jgi:hypothetical protein